MRILLDLQACQASSMHRGIGRYSMALALAMARNSGGHELRIVLNEGYPDSALAIRQAFDGLLPQAHITTFSIPVPTREIDPRNTWRMHTAERIREHYLASLQPDIVHVASLFEGLGDNSVVSVPLEENNYATSVTLYDLIPLMRKERYLGDPNVAAWYYRKLEQLKRARLLLSISASARDEGIALLGLPSERIVNISSAVDGMFRPRALSPEARSALLARHGLRREFIMYTGGIDYRKNIEGLLEAYAGLPLALRRQYQLAVVCSVPAADRVRLQRLAAKLKLSNDDLVLTGFVSDDDLVSLYNCTALFVFPSLHEGFGLPALEAMACGAPVIGSNASSIPEVIGRFDALFDPTSIAAIGASMAAVLGDPARQAALRAHGLAQAERFSWSESARRAIEAFEEVHRRRPPAAATRPGPLPARDAERGLLASIAALGRDVPEPDLLQTAAAIAANRPPCGLRQVLVDIGEFAETGKTCGAAPLSARLRTLVDQVPSGWRVEPVRHDGAHYRYARRLALDRPGGPDAADEDTVVDAKPGDVLLVLGESPAPAMPAGWLARGILACRLPAGSAAGDLAERLAELLNRGQT